jgi:hypothetical protein
LMVVFRIVRLVGTGTMSDISLRSHRLFFTPRVLVKKKARSASRI